MSKFKILAVSTLASMGVLVLTSAALAAAATATTNVNLRTGPGTNFSILGSLQRGQNVDAVECVDSGWCRVEHNGPSGWVASRYLAAPNQGQAAVPAQSPAARPASQNGACFYTEQNFGGREYCSGANTFNDLGTFNDAIRSYKVFEGAHVNFCVDTNMGGACYEGSRSTPTLGGPLDRQASSLSVFFPNGNQNNGGGLGAPAHTAPKPPAQAPAPQNPPVANNQHNANPDDPDCSFGLVLGPDGPTFSLTCGDNAILPPVAQSNGNGNGNAGNNNQGNAGNNDAGNNGGGIIAAPAPRPNIDISDLNIIGDQAPPLPPQNGGVNLGFGNQNGAQIPNLPPQNGFGAADQGGANNANFDAIADAGTEPNIPNFAMGQNHACFYTDPGFRGEEVCYNPGKINGFSLPMNDHISSVKLVGDAQVRLCGGFDLDGPCKLFTTSVANLGRNPNLNRRFDDQASSARIFRARDGITSITHYWNVDPINTVGSIQFDDPNNYENLNKRGLDLDSGFRTSPPQPYAWTLADIVYDTSFQGPRFTPINGAEFAPITDRHLGYYGCLQQSFSTQTIPASSINIGSFFCVLTSDGRYAEIQFKAPLEAPVGNRPVVFERFIIDHVIWGLSEDNQEPQTFRPRDGR